MGMLPDGTQTSCSQQILDDMADGSWDLYQDGIPSVEKNITGPVNCAGCGKYAPEGILYYNEVGDGTVEPTTLICNDCEEENEKLRKANCN